MISSTVLRRKPQQSRDSLRGIIFQWSEFFHRKKPTRVEGKETRNEKDGTLETTQNTDWGKEKVRVSLPNPDWDLVPQKRGLIAEASGSNSTFRTSRNHKYTNQTERYDHWQEK